MAKLSAFGRVEVCTFSKVDSSELLVSRTSKLRLMSDGVVLSKFDGVFIDGMKLTGTWKVHAKQKKTSNLDFAGFTEVFKNYATKRGYTEAA